MRQSLKENKKKIDLGEYTDRIRFTGTEKHTFVKPAVNFNFMAKYTLGQKITMLKGLCKFFRREEKLFVKIMAKIGANLQYGWIYRTFR
jgi:hypothetical protein